MGKKLGIVLITLLLAVKPVQSGHTGAGILRLYPGPACEGGSATILMQLVQRCQV